MIIEIDGLGRVEVDDSFANLNPSEQNNFVENVRRQSSSGALSSDEVESAPPAEKQRVRSLAQGVTLGFADELEAAIRNPISALGSAFGFEGKDYNERLKIVRDKLDSYRTENPLESMAYEMGGAILPTLAAGALTAGAGSAAVGASTAARLAPTALRAAKIGAAEGAVAGFGAGEGGLAERAKSAALGGTIGGTLGAVAPIATQQVGRVARNVLDSVGVGGEKRATTFAERKMLEAIDREGMTPERAGQVLQEARDLGVSDITLADLGEGTRGAAWSAQAVPNKSRQGVLEQFSERQAGQAEQISEQAAKMSGTEGATGVQYLDDLADKVQKQAGPAYKRAYSVDLDATPFQGMARSKVIQDAYNKAVELADIDPDIDVSGMPSNLGQFLGQAASKGEKVLMPTEVAHNIKKGLDVLIDAETDNLTRKATPRGRVLTKLKKSWDGEIASQNDIYKSANKQFADNASLKRAYDAGFDFNKTSEKQLVKNVSQMSSAEKEALRVGLVSQVEELASKTGDATDFVKTVFGTPRRRAALRLAFDNSEQFERFERLMKVQSDKMRTQRKVFGGSDTAERLLQSSDASIDPSAIYGIGARAATGDVLGAASMAGSQAASRLSGMNEKSASKLSEMIFNADPEAQREILQRLMARETTDVASRQRAINRPEMYSGVLGATGGLLSGRSE